MVDMYIGSAALSPVMHSDNANENMNQLMNRIQNAGLFSFNWVDGGTGYLYPLTTEMVYALLIFSQIMK